MIAGRALLLCCALYSLEPGARAYAQDGDDALGFSDAPLAAAEPSEAPAASDSESAPSDFHLSGQVAVQSAMRLWRSGLDRLGKLRFSFTPRLEYKHAFAHGGSFALIASGRAEADFAYLLRPDAYDAPTMEVYGSQLIITPTYLSFASRHFELSFGEQIANFGQGEVLTLLDVVNPRDVREPLFADLEELRLPLLMTRVGLSAQRFQGDFLVVHEPYFGLLPPPLGEFSPLRRLLTELPFAGPALSQRELRYEHIPARNPLAFGATQFHARLMLHLNRADLSLQASSLLDTFGVPSFPSASALRAPRIDLPTYHPRYTLVGQSGAVTLGLFLLRWELAADLGRPLIVRDVRSLLPNWGYERLNALRGLLGLTFVPTANTNLGLELSQSYVIDNPARRALSTHELLFPVEATQLALRFSQTFLRQRATITLVGLCIGLSEHNALAGRAEFSYLVTDDLRIALGGVGYLPTANFGPFYGFERNDRIYLNVRWSFAAH